MLGDRRLSLTSLLREYAGKIGGTWLLTLGETSLTALAPFFIGLAIDGLSAGRTHELIELAVVLVALTGLAICRRVYDTRAYGTIRVEVGRALVARASDVPVSTLSARLGMGQELVGFLEREMPALMTGVVQLAASVAVLLAFHRHLAWSAVAAVALTLLAYALFHRRFHRLHGHYNHELEQQVTVLRTRSAARLLAHLNGVKRIEVQLSDTEAVVYGAIFTVMLSVVLFNLWFAATKLGASVGSLFSIVSYSWEFVGAALALPLALQSWSRLSEITTRINAPRTAP